MPVTITPHATLIFTSQADLPWQDAFLHLATQDVPSDASERWMRMLAVEYLSDLCLHRQIPALPSSEKTLRWLEMMPPMKGGEYLSEDFLGKLWGHVSFWMAKKLGGSESLEAFMEGLPQTWRQLGKVHFNLAENKLDTKRPFAFLATYTEGVTDDGKNVHMSMGQALRKYASASDTDSLKRMFAPVQNASQVFPWVEELVDSCKIFHPLAFSTRQAYRMLKDASGLEECGIRLKLPNWWSSHARATVKVEITSKDSRFSADALMDFNASVALGGQELTPGELQELLSHDDQLVFFKGSWVEVDREKISQLLDRWKKFGPKSGLGFIQAMRMLSGISDGGKAPIEDTCREWMVMEPDATIREGLRRMVDPDELAPPDALKAVLRPYQKKGLSWLWQLGEMGLGACLADDMGLGKTMQVLAWLLREREMHSGMPPSLLVLPASLLGNWKREAEAFAPDLRLFVMHPSENPREKLENPPMDADLVVTTYGYMARNIERIAGNEWNRIIFDEAQALKNPSTRQTKAACRLKARTRLALTGTPIENSLGDLWSLFNCINPGLLGSLKEFKDITGRMDKSPERYAPLRRLIAPYILRRLKTDKSIIADLPEKSESIMYCTLTTAQAKLYAAAVKELADGLKKTADDRNARRGLVLTMLGRMKQICNHPSQALGTGDYEPKQSGKFMRLGELCSELAERQERVLVFTQYREIIPHLMSYLTDVFGRPGLALHGGTAIGRRKSLVDAFQREDGPPFFILSLKAGGTGLNLTAATHVIHFDRWWNPAVEDQATDRAYRIGQKKNVLVHPCIVRGTLEERIDDLLRTKRETARELLSGTNEADFASMTDEELLDLVRLDITKTGHGGE